MLKTFSIAIRTAFVAILISPEMAGAQPTAGGQVRLVVPFPAGGPTDIVARPLAQLLGDALKATVVIDNRGGAGGSLGADAVAKSAPDGRTLLMGTVGTHAINAALFRKLPYDTLRDFAPIAAIRHLSDENGERDQRYELDKPHDPEIERIVGEVVELPAHRDRQHLKGAIGRGARAPKHHE